MSEEGITQEEVEALTVQEDAPAAAGVRPRDFRQPRRISNEHLEELQTRISLDLGEVGGLLKPWYRSDQSITFQSISEVSFLDLPDSVGDQVCVLHFKVGESVGWVAWDTEAALAATARAMGVEAPSAGEEDESDEPDEASSKLSSVEVSIACNLVGEMLGVLGSTLGFSARDVSILQSKPALEDSIVELRGTDTQRLRVDLEIDGPGEPSTLKFYLPGFTAESSSAAKDGQPAPASVPEHLSKVLVEVSAEFDSIELSLNDILALEVGDVISLSTLVKDPMNLVIENMGCAKVQLGQKDGQLAVKLDSISLDSTPNP